MSSTAKKFLKISGALASLGIVALASYNTFVINLDSFMLDNEIKFVKRLDELNGLTSNGRVVAHNGNWKSLAPAKKAVEYKPTIKTKKVQKVAITKPVSTFKPEPAIKDELNLELSKAFHPGKDLKSKKVSGSLQAYYGVIDTIDFSIEGVASVSLSKVGKLSGNVFEYSFGDEVYTAMLYEQNKSTYMVTLTTGPEQLRGLRLQFKSADGSIDLPNRDASEEREALAQDMNETRENYEKGDIQENNKDQNEAPAQYGFNFSA